MGVRREPKVAARRAEVPECFPWCPHVVARKLPMILGDVCAYPRFAGNPVVDQFGIRAYIGAPLIDMTGTVLGTVCVVDVRAAPVGPGRPGLHQGPGHEDDRDHQPAQELVLATWAATRNCDALGARTPTHSSGYIAMTSSSMHYP